VLVADVEERTLPRWWPVLRSLALAWILTGIFVLLATLVVGELGAGYDREGAGRCLPWLFPTDDASGWAANLPLALLALALFTVVTRALLRVEDQAVVPIVPLALVLGVTGAFATLDESRSGEDGGRGLAAWFVAAWLVRYLPRREEPREHRRPPLPVVAGVAVGVAIMLAVPVAYAFLHPLRVAPADQSTEGVSLREGRSGTVRFVVENAGSRAVDLRSVGLDGRAAAVLVSGPQTFGSRGEVPLRLPRRLAPGEMLYVLAEARLVRGGCMRLMRETTGERHMVAERVEVRYRVAGRARTIRRPAEQALAIIGCEGGNVQWGAPPGR
jgi:hypothetical protein